MKLKYSTYIDQTVYLIHSKWNIIIFCPMFFRVGYCCPLLSIVIEGYKALPWHPCHKTAPLTVYIMNCFVFDLEVIILTWKWQINQCFHWLGYDIHVYKTIFRVEFNMREIWYEKCSLTLMMKRNFWLQWKRLLCWKRLCLFETIFVSSNVLWVHNNNTGVSFSYLTSAAQFSPRHYYWV